MPNPKIEEFARLLVQEVRDAAIQACDRRLAPVARGPMTRRWRTLASHSELEAIAQMLIPDIVDATLFELLRALDEGALKLSFTASNGEKVELAEGGAGELVGWYGGDWRSMYSHERVNDDFAHLRQWPPPGSPPPPRTPPEERD